MTFLAAALAVGGLVSVALGRWGAAVELGVIAAACALAVAVDRTRNAESPGRRSEDGSPDGVKPGGG